MIVVGIESEMYERICCMRDSYIKIKFTIILAILWSYPFYSYSVMFIALFKALSSCCTFLRRKP